MYKRLSPHANTTPPTKRKKKYIGNSQRMQRASLHTDGLNVYYIGLRLGPAIPDVFQTVGIKHWLAIVDTKIFLTWVDAAETNNGKNFAWTTSSTSASFERKLILKYFTLISLLIFYHLFTFHFCAGLGTGSARHDFIAEHFRVYPYFCHM